ncbi:PEP-CTERM sorting domain-containing protein [Microseira sp. BLCC-F43]|uniref:PEP-CTERM sorting domain-containing protein n=1 Tax=Microseira sp. BLCC-F43 TaxID=3153602 RepID=UPI0035B988CC
MKKLTAFASIAAIATILGLSPSVSAVNLLDDPGFEVEDFPAVWEINGGVYRVSDSLFLRSGNFGGVISADNGSIIQNLIVPAANQLKFGAYVRLFTGYPAGNFDQTQITLGVASAKRFQTAGFDPNALIFSYNSDLQLYQTDWILLESVLDVADLAGQTALLNINFQNTTDTNTFLAVDDAFVETVEQPSTSVPEPSSVLGLLALGGFAAASLRK